MRKIILIALGGFTGAVLRFAIKSIPISVDFPITTLLINMAGCFILAFVTTLGTNKGKADIKLGITTGFCGAFTTFSTLCKESVQYISKGLYNNALFYLLSLIILGLSAVYMGVSFANILNNRKEETISFYQDDTATDEVE